MKIVENYLKRDLKRKDLDTWEEIRGGYLERAVKILKNDWQSPAYLSSLENQAGRREGKVIGNINDYTRDQHDLALVYGKKFVKEYLPRVLLLPLEAYVTSSGMSALTTAIVALHRISGTDVVVMLGKHSYFQNQEMITCSFARVVLFDETDEGEWKKLIEIHNPIAVFVDTLCNEPNLTISPVAKIAQYLAQKARRKSYLIIDNSMLATQFDWRNVLKYRSLKLGIIGWESLNKYYQFGLDRTTGGILWGTGTLSVKISQARRHAGTIMPDVNVAMLPTPNRKIMSQYMTRIWQNGKILHNMIGGRGIGAGAQVVIKFAKKQSYASIQKIIREIIKRAKKERIQVSAGTSFGFPNTRIYLTARQTEFSQMFLRVSVGVEERDEIQKIAKIILKCLV